MVTFPPEVSSTPPYKHLWSNYFHPAREEWAILNYATFYQSLMRCTVGNVVYCGLANAVTETLYGLGTLKLAVKRRKTDLGSIFSCWKIATLAAGFSKVIHILYNICQEGQGFPMEMLKRGRERNTDPCNHASLKQPQLVIQKPCTISCHHPLNYGLHLCQILMLLPSCTLSFVLTCQWEGQSYNYVTAL